MKKLTLIVAILIVSNLLSAQWVQQSIQPSINLKETIFIDQNNGWVIGSGDFTIVYTTTNGGSEWLDCLELMNLPIHGCSIYFTDENNGWMSNGGGMGVGSEIWHTNTGELGCNSEWELQLEAESDYISSKLFFIDSLHGWYVGYFELSDVYISELFHTIDGGSNWIQNGSGHKVSDIVFIDTQMGWAIDELTASISGPSGLLQTVDGGENWTLLNDNVYGSAIYFHDSENGWIAGYDNTISSGFIKHTNDGGNNWENQTAVAIPALHDITFTDSINGWAVGNEGTILHTADGGQNWEYQESGTFADLYSVCFIDQNMGWICGDSGVILHTDNGGIVGIEENNQKFNISIYPNPANSIVHLQADELYTPEEVWIYNRVGQIVLHLNGKINEIDVSTLPSGIYILEARMEERVVRQKFVKR